MIDCASLGQPRVSHSEATLLVSAVHVLVYDEVERQSTGHWQSFTYVQYRLLVSHGNDKDCEGASEVRDG